MAAEAWSWWPLSAWISPGAAWFLLFNVIAGAVAVLSWRQQGGDVALSRGRRLTRSASSMVMERLRSLSSSFSFHSAAADYGSVTPRGSQLHHDAQVYYHTTPVMSLAELGAAAAAGESGTAASASGGDEAEAETGEKKMPICTDEVCAVAPQSPPPAAAADVAEAAATVDMPPRKREPAMVPEIVKRRAYACGRGAEEVEGKAEVNTRAERFIRQFREDLKLERINSILGKAAAPVPLRRSSRLLAPST